jgi:hypothetical protein
VAVNRYWSFWAGRMSGPENELDAYRAWLKAQPE